ncbi:RsiV family protein [Lysinibacillus sp. SGAir0095]|uniref:RsiV family protein n=1 Tax=Lysinibacillus sp. SGAir0095 TaxID=2070463 RepID=UPI0010CD2F05|nr:RsiV family protein [Lysinibacillus sp. SGAir0095]QCR31328.1 anti-sigma factor [Lysinibacillus sp. SGAir0095]
MNHNKMDKLIEEYKDIPIPAELSQVVESALQKQGKPRRTKTKWVAGAAAAAVIFTTSVNLSPALAKSLESVPVIGSVVNVLTVKEYKVDKGNYQADIEVPVIDQLDNKSLEQMLNAKYLEEGQQLYDNFISEMEQQQAFGKDGHLSVTSGYNIKIETEQLLSVGRYVEETAASSMTTIQYDTIDKQNKILVTLPSLFNDSSYIKVVSENIKQQMEQQMKNDSSKMYFIDSLDAPVSDGFKMISENQNFYVNANHKLVIAFNEYEVSPGYMGTVEFIIPTEVIQSMLVSNEYIK